MVDVGDDATTKQLREWRQGDVALDLRTFAYLQQQSSDDADPEFELSDFEGAVIVTQTCDLVRGPSEQPHVTVAPLVRLPEGKAAYGRGRRLIGYAHVPGAGPDAFADLSLMMTVDKALLVKSQRLRGCENEGQIRDFAEALKRRFGRFAFPDEVVELLRPLKDRFTSKKTAADRRLLESIQTVRCEAKPSWTDNSCRITIYFLVSPMSESDLESLRAAVEPWAKACNPAGEEPKVFAMVERLSDISAEDYLQLVDFDVDFLSPSGHSGG